MANACNCSNSTATAGATLDVLEGNDANEFGTDRDALHPPNYGSAGDWEARIEDGPFEITGYGGTEQEAIADCEHQWVEHCEGEELFKRQV
jgi:hypothetical protein